MAYWQLISHSYVSFPEGNDAFSVDVNDANQILMLPNGFSVKAVGSIGRGLMEIVKLHVISATKPRTKNCGIY